MGWAIQWALTIATLSGSALLMSYPCAAQASNGCKSLPGLWSWNGGSTKIDVKPNGTADVLCALCDKNLRWTCSGNVFKLSCCVFGVDLNLSTDGSRMSGARGTSSTIIPATGICYSID